jgi:ubiquinone/menaquinone biosynthesis C-methylase UbiE
MNDVAKQLRVSYDRLVSAYAARNDAETPARLLPLLNQLRDAVDCSGKILDVGCGTGREMAWFEARDVRVCGIDLSGGMLTYARSRVKGDLLAMDMTALAFRDASFDGVWCCASLLHLPKAQAKRALTEIHRVLKLGGALVLIVQEGTGEGWEESYVPNSSRYFARYSADELAHLVSRHGFDVQEIAAMSGGDRDWLSCVSRR